jgi:hypothetical protein
MQPLIRANFSSRMSLHGDGLIVGMPSCRKDGLDRSINEPPLALNL